MDVTMMEGSGSTDVVMAEDAEMREAAEALGGGGEVEAKMGADQRDTVSSSSSEQETTMMTSELAEWKAALQGLPPGAERIVKSLAAEQILFEMLNHFNESLLVPHRQVMGLIQQYPSICHRAYVFDWYEDQTRQLTPLAVLCCLKAPLRLIQLVYSKYPEAICIAEPNTTAIPLDYACSYEASTDVIQFLMEKHPDALQTARHEGLLPLHLACHFKGTFSTVKALLEACPETIENCESAGWYPVHAAAAGGASVEVFEYLHKAMPDATTAQDSHRQTPLHIACFNDTRLDVAQFLIQSAPETLTVIDRDNMTPLFRAVRSCSAPVVEFMLNFPVQQFTVDGLGGTLIHHAAGYSSDIRTMELLCERFPAMLRMRTADPDRLLPLHVAALFGAKLEVVRLLIQKCPSSVLEKDGRDRLASALARTCRVRTFLLEQERQAKTNSINNAWNATEVVQVD